MGVKAGFVAVVGQTNAGKSSLVNALVGEKVAIVSHRPQTTRQRVVGILSGPGWQVAFVDTPGFVRATQGLNAFLQKEAQSVMEEADLVMAVFDADEDRWPRHQETLEQVKSSGRPWFAVLTKADLASSEATGRLREAVAAEKVLLVEGSTLKASKVWKDRLLPEILKYLPESSACLFDPDEYTTQNLRQMAAEIVREKCFEILHQEIPYGLAVKVNSFEEGSLVKIQADLLLNKENHRAIVIGAGGRTLKAIGSQARVDLEKTLGTKVFLELYVKAKKNWLKNPSLMKELGYVHGK